MQDGNWNTIAICDITGSVGERYAYSAYGTPVFMTGAGVVQSASTIGFETLYAGYRWDGTTPQMYYVRNRFLLPMIGTWNRRDPLGYVDGLGLYKYGPTNPMNGVDPDGLDWTMMPLPWGMNANKKGGTKRCIFTMKDPASQKRWDDDARALYNESDGSSALVTSVTSIYTMLATIQRTRCCEIVMIGHRGGLENPGIVTEGSIIFPNATNATWIANVLRSIGCKSCTLNIFSCQLCQATDRQCASFHVNYSRTDPTMGCDVRPREDVRESAKWRQLASITGCQVQVPTRLLGIGYDPDASKFPPEGYDTCVPGGRTVYETQGNETHLQVPPVRIFRPRAMQ